MKKSILILSVLSMPFFSMAQEKSKQRELGFSFSNLDNFGLTYRTGNGKSLWRFNTILFNGKDNKSETGTFVFNEKNFGFGLKFGKEYRKVVSDNFEIRYGVDLSYEYSLDEKTRKDNSGSVDDAIDRVSSHRPGINFVFGLNYVIKKNLVFGAELMPGINYITSTTTFESGNAKSENDLSGMDYGLSTNSALLSVIYRF